MDRDEVLYALRASRGSAWPRYRSLGAPLVDFFFDYLVEVADGGNLYLARFEVRQWRVLVAELGTARQGVFAALLLGNEQGGYYLRELGSDAPDALIELLSADAFVRSAAMGKGAYHFSALHALRWLAAQTPDRARPLFRSVVGTATRRGPRQAAAMGLAASNDHEGLCALLSSRGAREAAEALEELADPAALPSLRDARVGAKGRTADAIDAALIACRTAAIDPSEPDEAVLDQALAAIGGPPHPDMPELGWSSGTPISQGATDWFIDRLLNESLDEHEPMLVPIRARMADQPCHDLCEALLASLDTNPNTVLAQALIASPRRIEALGRALDTIGSQQISQYGRSAVAILARNNSAAARRWLAHWAQHTTTHALRAHIEATADAAGPPERMVLEVEPEVPWHPMLASALSVADPGLWPDPQTPPVPKLALDDQIQVGIWCVEHVASQLKGVAASSLGSVVRVALTRLEAKRAKTRSVEPDPSLHGLDPDQRRMAQLMLEAPTNRPDMAFMGLRSITARATRQTRGISGSAATRQFLASLCRHIEVIEAQAAVDRYAPDKRSVARVLWRHDRGNGVAGHFVVVLATGQHAAVTKLRNRWRYVEGDRDHVLATFADEAVFTAVVTALVD